MKRVQLLDCTLRDGAYVVNAEFGAQSIRGIIKRLQEANIDLIECGWLKNDEHKFGTTYYHTPGDILKYLPKAKNKYTRYVAMIDYNRYDISNLPVYDGKAIDSIRIVFPLDKVKEGIALVAPIKAKGYKVFLQASNTLAYSDYELLLLIDEVNHVEPEAISIVDTFGAMHGADLLRILYLMDNNLKKSIRIGFHSHNNQQMSYALSIQFSEILSAKSERSFIIDSSLCGMGRGAGNATTELVAGYLNRAFYTDYDMNVIMDTIDMYMQQYMDKYKWGYSIPYLIAGMYGCHVNNVDYLTKTHRTKSKDMKIIFDSLDKKARTNYDYDNLEEVYIEYQNKEVNDVLAKEKLQKWFSNKILALILPGKTSFSQKRRVDQYIQNINPLIIGINAIVTGYEYDYLFFSNTVKYEYALENYPEQFSKSIKIITSNIKVKGNDDEIIINYNDIQKRGWTYFDNSMIMFLRLMSQILPKRIAIAGFDGYEGDEREAYVDSVIQPQISGKNMKLMQKEIEDMLYDYIKTNSGKILFECITDSDFEYILRGDN